MILINCCCLKILKWETGEMGYFNRKGVIKWKMIKNKYDSRTI